MQSTSISLEIKAANAENAPPRRRNRANDAAENSRHGRDPTRDTDASTNPQQKPRAQHRCKKHHHELPLQHLRQRPHRRQSQPLGADALRQPPHRRPLLLHRCAVAHASLGLLIAVFPHLPVCHQGAALAFSSICWKWRSSSHPVMMTRPALHIEPERL